MPIYPIQRNKSIDTSLKIEIKHKLVARLKPLINKRAYDQHIQP